MATGPRDHVVYIIYIYICTVYVCKCTYMLIYMYSTSVVGVIVPAAMSPKYPKHGVCRVSVLGTINVV